MAAFLSALGPLAARASVNGTTGNFPFPQNQDNPYGIHASVYNNQDVLDAYNKWYADCVTSSGAGGFLRVQRPNDSGLLLNSTVSEGIGYAMVIAVYMNDENLFDNIWKYEQLHLDGNKLMNWYIDSSGGTAGSGAATDADEDMAWALLMASRQWGGSGTLGGTYLNYAVSQINNLYATELNSGIPDGGDGFIPINPSYFAPAYYREFASAAGQTGWLTVAANCYTVLNDNLGQGYGNAANGLVSAWCTSAGVSTATNAAPYDYQYDACRTPFRILQDYLWFGTAQSQAYDTLTSNFFSGVGAVSIVDGYYFNGAPHPHLPTLTVSQNPGFQSAAFVGPAGCGGMVSHNYQAFVDQAYQDLVGSKLLVGGTYYDESWTVMSLLMMSGNFLDYRLYTTPTPTPTLSAYSPLTIRVNAGGATFTDTAGAAWSADQ
ncbi:MAG TPA: glycosyl hydrolase family 8, partial [bacterium]|nr:glycosyl hydrolase family 8 [bacterium]